MYTRVVRKTLRKDMLEKVAEQFFCTFTKSEHTYLGYCDYCRSIGHKLTS